MSEDSRSRNIAIISHDLRSYLLRIWKTRANHETWRASLEQVGSGERLNFASLQALFEYLEKITRNPPAAEEGGVDEAHEQTPD